MDYDLILSEFYRILPAICHLSLDFDYLFVDEIQDSAEADWRIYRELGMHWKFFVGDPDQSIYGFRGAALDEMIAYGQDLATHVIKLETNFRSRQQICAAANRLIEHNVKRLPKKTESSVCENLGTVQSLGLLMTEGEEIAKVARTIADIRENSIKTNGDRPSIAILTRTNHLASVFRDTLGAGGVIPVVAREEVDLPRDWNFARSIVELLANPDNDTMAYFNMVSSLTRDGTMSPKKAAAIAHDQKLVSAAAGVSINRRVMKYPVCKTANDAAIALQDLDVSLESRMVIGEKLRELPRDASVLDLALAMAYTRKAVDETGDRKDNPVEVLTLHGAKGYEWDVVFLVGFEDEVIPGKRKEVDIEEERRLSFVGLTRARYEVYISGAATRVTKWGSFEKHTPSRFAAEIFAA